MKLLAIGALALSLASSAFSQSIGYGKIQDVTTLVATNATVVNLTVVPASQTPVTTNLVVNFASNSIRTVTATGALNLTGTGYVAGTTITLYILGAVLDKDFTFDSNWVFVGSAAPDTLSSNKVVELRLVSTTTTAAGVRARYLVEQ